MAKSARKKDTRCFGYSLQSGLFAGGFAVVLIAAITGAWLASKNADVAPRRIEGESNLAKLKARRKNRHVDDAIEELGKVQDQDGLGPAVMAGQAGLLGKLLKLLKEVEEIQGDDRKGERFQASLRVESELKKIEAEVDASTAMGKQQMGLITLVRSALKLDREGGAVDEEEWSDENLLKQHGLATYATQAYWDEAYSGGRYGESFDWYGSWEEPDQQGRSLSEIVRPLLKKEAKILVLGAGNSNMTQHMYTEGFRQLVNIDIAESVVKQMKERHAGLAGVEWHTMDAGEMTFKAGEFDAVVEKGLFDALFAGTGTRVQTVLAEAERVLKPGGRLVSVSFASDRVSRLFSGDAEAATSSSLDCRVAGELHYKKKANATEEEKKPGQQQFYVYSCDRA